MELLVESGCLGFLVLVTLVEAWPIPQPPPLLGPLPVAAAQPSASQIIKYETEQGLNGYSLMYQITDGTARREQGNLEDGVWIVFWGARWMDDSKTPVTIVSDHTGVSWSINSGIAIDPVAFVPFQPPRPEYPFSDHLVPTIPPPPIPEKPEGVPVAPYGGKPYAPSFGYEVIDLKKDPDPEKPFFKQSCKDLYVINKKGEKQIISGLSCKLKASLAGGSYFNYP